MSDLQQLPPKRVWIIKHTDGSYYSNKSGSTLPTIFMTYGKAAGRVKMMINNNDCFGGGIPVVHMWDITETLLGPTQL